MTISFSYMAKTFSYKTKTCIYKTLWNKITFSLLSL